MFTGHFAVGFAAKKINPKPSLGTYFLAAQFLDLLWPTLLLLKIETATITSDSQNAVPILFTHYPFSHSLLLVAGWSLLFGGIYYLYRRNYRAALIIGLCVLSHWILDLLVHVPDLPLYPGSSPLLGFGLWKYKIIALAFETILFVVGVVIYLRATTAINKKGLYGTWALILFLFGIHSMNTFGPPPPSMESVAWVGQMQWLFVAWAYWIDHNRKNRINEIITVNQPVPGSPVLQA